MCVRTINVCAVLWSTPIPLRRSMNCEKIIRCGVSWRLFVLRIGASWMSRRVRFSALLAARMQTDNGLVFEVLTGFANHFFGDGNFIAVRIDDGATEAAAQCGVFYLVFIG
jgi:hypothetical protein